MCVMICAKVAIFLIFAGKMSKITLSGRLFPQNVRGVYAKSAVSLIILTRRLRHERLLWVERDGLEREKRIKLGERRREENECRDFAVS